MGIPASPTEPPGTLMCVAIGRLVDHRIRLFSSLCRKKQPNVHRRQQEALLCTATTTTHSIYKAGKDTYAAGALAASQHAHKRQHHMKMYMREAGGTS
jgi:hypothetical protein